jgi:hypothetical protein
VAGHCREVRVIERHSDREGISSGRVRRIGVPVAQLLLGDRNAR